MDSWEWLRYEQRDADRRAEEAAALLDAVEQRQLSPADRRMLLAQAGRVLRGAKLATTAVQEVWVRCQAMTHADLHRSCQEARAEAAQILADLYANASRHGEWRSPEGRPPDAPAPWCA